MYGYVGHPLQGLAVSYIWLQNDPKANKLEFSNTKAYWYSRLEATLWNAIFSLQWNNGPLSEMTVEKYGTKDRPPWNSDGTYPCNTKHCYTGVGQIDLVMTPLGGLGLLVGEDFLDKYVTRRVERDTSNRFLIDFVRCGLDPMRMGTNILHGERPWYRASRDKQASERFYGLRSFVYSFEASKARLPHRGDLFLGYTHSGAAHCEAIYSSDTIACDPFSAETSNLNGWNVSAEKMYLRYFGIVADFSGQYGSVNQTTSLFGLRGGAWAGRFRPFGQIMIGAVHAREYGSAAIAPETSFAEDLGVGIDFRLAGRFSWSTEADELKTGTNDFERRSVRMSSGLAIQF